MAYKVVRYSEKVILIMDTSKKIVKKDIVLAKQIISCIDRIQTVIKNSVGVNLKNLIHYPDALASANFQLIQINRCLNGISKDTKKYITAIDLCLVSKMCKNLIYDYQHINYNVLLQIIKEIKSNSFKQEILHIVAALKTET